MSTASAAVALPRAVMSPVVLDGTGQSSTLGLAGSLPLGCGSRLTLGVSAAGGFSLPTLTQALVALRVALQAIARAPQSHQGSVTELAEPSGTSRPSMPTRAGIAGIGKQRVGGSSEPPRRDPDDGATQVLAPIDPVWDAVRRAQEGDPEAFGEIYDRYVETVYRYVYFRVSNKQLAEDLTSEAFLRALRRIGSVTWQGRDLGAWLVTIARNLIADHYKSGRYRLEISTADMLDEDRPDGSYGGRPESEVLDHLTNTTLLEAVKRLNPEQQECIVLRFLQGMSVAETANIMGKNDGAIKALQYRAVRSLGRLLPEGFTP